MVNSFLKEQQDKNKSLGYFIRIISVHSYFQNILRLFDFLPNFPFTTSETKRDC